MPIVTVPVMHRVVPPVGGAVDQSIIANVQLVLIFDQMILVRGRGDRRWSRGLTVFDVVRILERIVIKREKHRAVPVVDGAEARLTIVNVLLVSIFAQKVNIVY